MIESLKSEIKDLEEQRESLNNKISQKRLEINEILLRDELKKFHQAEDKLQYLCFDSSFENISIKDSQGNAIILDFLDKELSRVFSTEDSPIPSKLARYLCFPSKGVFDSQFQSSNLKLSNIKKIESFLIVNKEKMMMFNKENKKIFKTNENFILINPWISDIHEGVVLILWNREGATIIKQKHTYSITVLKKCDTLEQAYLYLKKFSFEDYNIYE